MPRTLSTLPYELLLDILPYLDDLEGLLALSQTSYRLRTAAQNASATLIVCLACRTIAKHRAKFHIHPHERVIGMFMVYYGGIAASWFDAFRMPHDNASSTAGSFGVAMEALEFSLRLRLAETIYRCFLRRLQGSDVGLGGGRNVWDV